MFHIQDGSKSEATRCIFHTLSKPTTQPTQLALEEGIECLIGIRFQYRQKRTLRNTH